MRIPHRARRFLALAATGALALALFPAAGAVADEHNDVCAGAESPFTDTSPPHAANIDCMFSYGVTTGTSETTFNQQGNLNRGQAATLLVEFAVVATDGAIAEDLDGEDAPFTDIDGNTHEDNINVLYELGLISGFDDNTYRPAQSIARDQFASILFGAHQALEVEFEDDYDLEFDDVADDNPHADAIAALTEEGIFSGTGEEGVFNPAGNITRGQTASVLALSARLLDDLGLWDAQRLTTNQTFMVTPQDEATNSLDGEDSSREYTVENPAEGEDHTIELFDADNVEVSDGIVSFEEDNGDAQSGDPVAVITEVNGTVVADGGDGQVEQVQSADGVITFTIDGVVAESVIPVVYFDDGGGDSLQVDEDGLPEADEQFGIGGQKNWTPVAATEGEDYDGTVVDVNRDAGYYTLDEDGDGVADVLVTYEGDDTFRYDDASINLGQFEEWVSAGDTVDVAGYNPGGAAPGDATIHDITDDVTGAPQNLTAELVESDDPDVRYEIEAEWDAPDPAEGRISNYRLFVGAADDADTADACATLDGIDLYGQPGNDPEHPDGPTSTDGPIYEGGGSSGDVIGWVINTDGTETETTIELEEDQDRWFENAWCGQGVAVSETAAFSGLSNTVTVDPSSNDDE